MDVRQCLLVWVARGCSLGLISCGASPDRELQSISLSPEAAESQGEGVQFTATGHWNTAPIATTPLTASWGVCQDNAATTAVTVTQAGVATCRTGAKGTYTIFADDPPTSGPVCNVVSACGGGCQITGSAQLTCP